MSTAVRGRVVLAKPGLDGHDRGIKVVGMALRDAGFEVIYLGLHVRAEEAVAAAVAEDADVIGLSVLSGVHLAVTEEYVAECRRAGLDDVAVVVGGTIPPQDVPRLLGVGARAVYPVGTPLEDVVDGVRGVVDERRGVA
ncbi:cobalamin-dependent protein [Nocardioides caldifontis]|uniref:cobalamin-dependent protein n=1 Tax=Nocardioides caldifontis TaxID=2588938 RepID=UPI001EF08F30|nr:cobalamin-dependent protein [Nocardioides caldifontis]